MLYKVKMTKIIYFCHFYRFPKISLHYLFTYLFFSLLFSIIYLSLYSLIDAFIYLFISHLFPSFTDTQRSLSPFYSFMFISTIYLLIKYSFIALFLLFTKKNHFFRYLKISLSKPSNS